MSHPVRIPADVFVADKILGPLTARQLLILTSAGALLYLAWTLFRDVVPLAVFAVVALPVGATVTVFALGKRDGISLDRLLVAAVRHRVSPHRLVPAPTGVTSPPAWAVARAADGTNGPVPVPIPVRLPITTVSAMGNGTGIADLGPDGLAVILAVSTVNLGLRTPAEQDSLVGVFARYLHSLTTGVQILVRATALDVSPHIRELHQWAQRLATPAAGAAAIEHATYLAGLVKAGRLTRRQVLLVLREPATPTAAPGMGGASLWEMAARLGNRRKPAAVMTPARQRAAQDRLTRRAAEAISLLAAGGVTVTTLSAEQTTAILLSACNPGSTVPPSGNTAAAGSPVTGARHLNL